MIFAAGLARTEAGWVRAATEIGLWLTLVPIFFTVTHRMLPFFSGSVVRGYVEYRSTRPLADPRLRRACMRSAASPVCARGSCRISSESAAVLWLGVAVADPQSVCLHLLAMHHFAGLWFAQPSCCLRCLAEWSARLLAPAGAGERRCNALDSRLVSARSCSAWRRE